ncbi:MAG TPA: U32 family peptidase [Bryobacteraceae bacterium]|nr:U32 family peptidase [Bryobacteraceae bacterium]
MTKPEVLSPAGYWPQLHAAIEAGADAVYFGLTHFTARAKTGFTLVELPEALRTLHRRGVKGYVTFNSLIWDSEIESAARGLAAIAEAGADAILVQDLAVVKLARRIAPGLDIHASTQMSITSADGANQARELGVKRVVLARELSLDEIRAIQASTDVELELFVHGALCVSYSGQCFSSEAWGGRSANRGQCAQACRLPYEMLVDGIVRPLGDARYLLSPGDLFALRQVPEIVQMGVAALKIEGRYKDAEYVALTTRAYREAVDAARLAPALIELASRPAAQTELQLEQVYSRGLGPYFLTGTNHQAVVKGRAPRHRGVLIGRVVSASSTGVIVEAAPEAPRLDPGDGLVFDAADWRSPQEPEEGGRVFSVEAVSRGRATLQFANGAINAARIRPGDLVWRTHSPAVDKAARPFLENSAPVARQGVDVRVTAHVGAALRLDWSLAARPDVRVEVCSETTLEAAQHRGLNQEVLREQLGRLGNTPYALKEVTLDAQGSPFVPVSVLNQLRRDAVERLSDLQSRPERIEIGDPGQAVRELRGAPSYQSWGVPQLHLLVRTPEQLDAALEVRPASITLDYLDLYGLRPSLDRIKARNIEARVASPRVLKPGEERIVDFLLRCDVPILVRPAGLLHALRSRPHAPLTGDFSLNAANAISAAALLGQGLDRLTPTHDLNAAQTAALAQAIGPARVEVVAYQHLPVFHTEHCVFCRFLSTGTSYKDCGRPCERHRVALRDTEARAHPVMADVGCRNTVFGSEAQEASRHLDSWLAAGIRHFRLEFVHESAAHVERIAAAFREYFARPDAGRLQTRLRQLAPQGVTEGSLFVPPVSNLLPVLQ